MLNNLIRNTEELELAVKNAEKGDVLVLTELSILGRTLTDAVNMLIIIRQKRIHIATVKENYSSLKSEYQMTYSIIDQMKKDIHARYFRERRAKQRGEKNGKSS